MTMISRVHNLEVLVRKFTTEVSDLSNELVAVKNVTTSKDMWNEEAHQTHLNDSPQDFITLQNEAPY